MSSIKDILAAQERDTIRTNKERDEQERLSEPSDEWLHVVTEGRLSVRLVHGLTREPKARLALLLKHVHHKNYMFNDNNFEIVRSHCQHFLGLDPKCGRSIFLPIIHF